MNQSKGRPATQIEVEAMAAIANLQNENRELEQKVRSLEGKLDSILEMKFSTVHKAGRRLREIINREGAGSAVEVGSEDYVIRAAIVALFNEESK